MTEHEHTGKVEPEKGPAHDEMAKKAYAIDRKEGRPQGHAEQEWLEAEAHSQHVGSGHPDHHKHPDHHAHMAADFQKRFWISLALALPILLLSPLLQKLVGLREAIRFPGDVYVLFGFSSAVFWYGGWPFLKGLFKELKSRQPGMMALVAVAITTAYLYSSAVVFGLTGKMFFNSVNEAMLTGESTPVSKKTGGKVIGGSINGEGSLTIEVKGTGKDSFLSQIIDLVKQAQESKSKTQNLADTAALWLTFIALGSGALTLLIWLVFMNHEFAFAIERAVTVMVIPCPHALGLAVPLVVAVSTALAASNGLLIRNRVAFERARTIKAIILDKTGTLTEGRFGVTDTLVLSQDIDEDMPCKYAASVDASSEPSLGHGLQHLRHSAGGRSALRVGRAAHSRPRCRADVREHGDCGHQRATAATEEISGH